jgi:division protein CdvB (Snf7/Vps24/ESCRT-III family)
MATVFQETERELGNIGDLLNGIIMASNQNSGPNISFETAGDDAQKILKEAATIAEQKIKEKFPELPSDMPTFQEEVEIER